MTVSELVTKYKYKPLPTVLSAAQRAQYIKELPGNIKLNGDLLCELYAGYVKISNGYRRVVVGDYGAYIEISPSQIITENLIIKPGEEYRFDRKWRTTVKYFWLCPRNWTDVKIYFQQRRVDYADYQPLMFYISPFEVAIKQKKED